MSRYTIANVFVHNDVVVILEDYSFALLTPKRNVNIAYGFDYACGYFLQMFERSTDDLVLDVDSYSNGLSGSKLGTILLKIIESMGSMYERIHKPNIERAMMDLPF